VTDAAAPVPAAHAGRSRQVDAPEPRFFVIRLVKRGPWVPARIRHDFGQWWAEVEGRVIGEKSENPLTADWVLRIWHFGREITQPDYFLRLARPKSQRLDPHKPVDLRNQKALF
jgi:hypothetical protein